MMDAHTINQETRAGFRELIENLHEQIEADREREAVLLRLLEQVVLHLSGTGRTRVASAQRPPGEPSPLHSPIFAVLLQHPAGCTPAQIQDALGTDRPLADLLRGLWRRGRLARVGPGRYALPGHSETGHPVKEMSDGQ